MCGMHWMLIPGPENPYDSVWGIGAGLGAKIPIPRVSLEAELPAHVILSDYGNFDFEWLYFYPVTVGIRF